MKHLNDRGLPASSAVVIATSWQPKEDWASFQSGLLTLFTVLEDNQIPLRRTLRCVLLDGAPGAEKAVRTLLPEVPICRDLRHVEKSLAADRLLASF